MRTAILFVTLAAAASAGPCLVGSLQDYIGLGAGGCTLGSSPVGPLVSNFATFPGITGATPIDPNLVSILPLEVGFQKSLQVTLNTTATAAQIFETFFNFQITGGPIGSAALVLSNVASTDDGAVTAIIDTCRDGKFGGAIFGCSGTQDGLLALQTAGFSQLVDMRSFPLSSFFDVFFDFTVDGGLSGSANAGSATLTVGQVPEPGSLALMIFGGLTLIGLRQRLKPNGGVK